MPAVSEQVADKIVAAIGTIALSPTPAAVRKRKRPLLLDGEQTPIAGVSVADGEEFEPVGNDGSGNLRWLVRYPAAVWVAFRSGGKATENSDLRNWLEDIWTGLTRQSLRNAGLTQINEVYPDGRPFFDLPASTAGVDWGAKFFRIETLESR